MTCPLVPHLKRIHYISSLRLFAKSWKRFRYIVFLSCKSHHAVTPFNSAWIVIYVYHYFNTWIWINRENDFIRWGSQILWNEMDEIKRFFFFSQEDYSNEVVGNIRAQTLCAEKQKLRTSEDESFAAKRSSRNLLQQKLASEKARIVSWLCIKQFTN